MWTIIQNFLRQPFPTYKQHKKQVLVCAMAGVTVFIMLYILEPFGIHVLSHKAKLVYAVTYSSITLFVCLLLTVVFPYLYPKFFRESKWTVCYEILYILFILTIISVVNLYVHHILDKTPFNSHTFLLSVSYTLPLAAFPVSVSILIKQKWLQQLYKNEALLLNQLIKEYQTNHQFISQKIPSIETAILQEVSNSSQQISSTNAHFVTLTGTGVGEAIELSVNDFLLANAADNYIQVHYTENETIKTILLRNTLKNAETKTQHFNQIIRCHRSFLINVDKVERIIGDAQGIKILIKGIEQAIPVGKLYLNEVKQLLGQQEQESI